MRKQKRRTTVGTVDVEAQFAACLLAVGGPDRLKDNVTTAEYLFVCADWYDKVIEQGGLLGTGAMLEISRPARPWDRISDVSRNKTFTAWWVEYKTWLTENWRG